MTALTVLAKGLFVDGGPKALALLVPLIAYFVYARLRRGTYWLTSERLVWMLRDGEPVQIPLRSIREVDSGFPFRHSVRVVGERESFTLAVDGMEQLQALLLALDLRRKPPLLDSATAERLADVVCYPATLRGDYSRKGYVVVRPGYVAFLPMERGGDVLRAITDTWPTLFNVHIPSIIEQLRYLPSGAAFDACMERAVADAAGERWRAEEVLRYEAHTPVVKRLHFQTIDRPQKSLMGKVDPSQQDAAERILASWPKR